MHWRSSCSEAAVAHAYIYQAETTLNIARRIVARLVKVPCELWKAKGLSPVSLRTLGLLRLQLWQSRAENDHYSVRKSLRKRVQSLSNYSFC